MTTCAGILADQFSPTRLLAALADGDVEFVVIGGVALTLHGGASVTRDLDIYYRRTRENVHRLASVLGLLEARLRDFPDELPFTPDAATLWAATNFTFMTTFGPLDCLGEVRGVSAFDQLAAGSEAMRLGKRSHRIAGLDALIAMKRAAGRPKDANPLLELEELRRLRRESGAE